jgi:hypothetical protein
MAGHGAPSTRQMRSERVLLFGLDLENAHSHGVGGCGGEICRDRIEPRCARLASAVSTKHHEGGFGGGRGVNKGGTAH